MTNLLNALPSGWKSLTGGIALMILGLAGLKNDLRWGPESSIAAIAAGLGMIGLAHKAERTRSDVETSRLKVEILQKQVEGIVDRRYPSSGG